MGSTAMLTLVSLVRPTSALVGSIRHKSSRHASRVAPWARRRLSVAQGSAAAGGVGSPVDEGKAPIYITTPIYYVNDKPHIGHAYTTLACDVLARSKTLMM